MHHAKIDNYLIRENKLLISTKKLSKKSYFLQKDNILHRNSVPILLFIGVYQGMRFIDHGGKTTFLFAWWKFVPEKRTFDRFPFSSFYRFPFLWRHVIRVASSFLLATSFSSTTYHDVSESPTRSPLQKGKWMFTVSHRLFTALLSSLPIKIRGINR